MKLLLVTDAWAPQINGVVRTLQAVVRGLEAKGWEVKVVHPGLFKSFPMPSYQEIRIAWDVWRLKDIIKEFAADCIQIETEGPLGLAARNICIRNDFRFTTALHTKFPEYIHLRTGIPLVVGYSYLRWFHSRAHSTLVTTQSMKEELMRYGMDELVVWGRGVDTEAFSPCARTNRDSPKLTYVGRVSVEKNIRDFLDLEMDAEKVVIGDGPSREELMKEYPDVKWLGYKVGEELAFHYSDSDVFVFPSRTDTFGLVMLEAMSCGTPVAAYPVTGPIDVVVNGVNGHLSDSLEIAVKEALKVDRSGCRSFALDNSWSRVVDVFQSNLIHVNRMRSLKLERDYHKNHGVWIRL